MTLFGCGSGSLQPGLIVPDRGVGQMRQYVVSELMAKGLSRDEISGRLGVSTKCVSVFIERARGKFHLKTSLQLRHLAFRFAMFADNERDKPYWKARVRERANHSGTDIRQPALAETRQRRGAASGVKSCQFKTLPTIAPDTLALRRMFRFHFRDGYFPSAEQNRSRQF